MPSDNYNCPFVVTMTPGITDSGLHQGNPVVVARNMIMGLRTHMPQPMWPVKVSHVVPVGRLGNLHGEKQVQDLVRGYCGCFGEVEDRK